MSDLDAIRARAAAHADEIESVQWLTVSDLARRWRLSETTVRGIPLAELKYKEFGNGAHLKRRRYKLAWVEAYENTTGRTAGEDAA